MACLTKYSRNATWHLTFQLPTCASHMAFSRKPLLANFLWASRKTALIFIACLILYQLNTKPNTIKSHKIRGNKIMQLQHFLSCNKANIKHSCKSQLYNIYIYIYIYCYCLIYSRISKFEGYGSKVKQAYYYVTRHIIHLVVDINRSMSTMMNEYFQQQQKSLETLLC